MTEATALFLGTVSLFFALWFTAVLIGRLWYERGASPGQFAVPAFFWALFWALQRLS